MRVTLYFLHCWVRSSKYGEQEANTRKTRKRREVGKLWGQRIHLISSEHTATRFGSSSQQPQGCAVCAGQLTGQALVIVLLRLVQRAHKTGRSFLLCLGLYQLDTVSGCSSIFYTVGALNHHSSFPRGPLVWQYYESIKYSNSKLTLIRVLSSLSSCLLSSSASLLSTASELGLLLPCTPQADQLRREQPGCQDKGCI